MIWVACWWMIIFNNPLISSDETFPDYVIVWWQAWADCCVRTVYMSIS